MIVKYVIRTTKRLIKSIQPGDCGSYPMQAVACPIRVKSRGVRPMACSCTLALLLGHRKLHVGSQETVLAASRTAHWGPRDLPTSLLTGRVLSAGASPWGLMTVSKRTKRNQEGPSAGCEDYIKVETWPQRKVLCGGTTAVD